MKIIRYTSDSAVSNSLLILPTASLDCIHKHNNKKQKEPTIMKKFFILIIAVAAMLNFSSCSDEQIDKPSPRTAIVFNDVQTRAIVNSADELLEMGVFAQMNLGDEDKQEAGSNNCIMILENEHVSRADAGPETPWTYEHTRYWITDRVYHFFAVWPYSERNASVTNVSSVAGDGAYGYSVTFETPEAADQDLLTSKASVKTKTGDPFPESVGFNFKHELTNVNLKIWSNGAPDNIKDKIKVKEVTISNVTKKGTLNVAALSDSSWSYSSTKMAFTKTYGDGGITVSQAQIIDGQLVPNATSEYNPSNNNPGIPFGDGLLLIPHTITKSNPVIVTVIYDLQRPIDEEENLWEEKKLQAFLPEGTWPAGKKLTYNLILSGERTITEFQINTVVEDWYPQTEEIDFTEQVVVEKMNWVDGTYESWNKDTGKIVLFTDVDKVAVCEFNILSPAGATWTASLIPLTASAMDAFSIVEDSKYGDVGTEETQRIKIKINNPDPISARNACLLRITVQTSDGRTIIVKNLMPDPAAKNGVEEFTIIQNLING